MAPREGSPSLARLGAGRRRLPGLGEGQLQEPRLAELAAAREAVREGDLAGGPRRAGAPRERRERLAGLGAHQPEAQDLDALPLGGREAPQAPGRGEKGACVAAKALLGGPPGDPIDAV